ncbi:MAG: acyl-CoA dehydrogenase [Deltaproteobacteria bacterium]|nr:MAG: acyl-CoA dehydrogenase [Deltaproteobacteria bacterium]
MILLNPKQHRRAYRDERSRELMLRTIDFFERKGKRRLKADDRTRIWYADFLEFVKQEGIFATICTPAGYGAPGSRWDTWRICEFAEILAFYGLQYWYTWQVSVLGLGPIWMSRNEAVKRRAAQRLRDGGIFAFGLSEKEHGADVYATETTLFPTGEGTYTARGRKYYIGNANKAAMVSTFGKLAGTGEYVFFVADPTHEKYECVQNVVNSQNFVAEFALHDYPVTEADILAKGDEAWNAALNTVNIGKFNLGWASIGICTHAFYEAIDHAASRRLYGRYVTDFPHVKRMFVDAYARLVAMKLVALRAADYMRAASPDDRRFLLYNPVVKMKVTTQGEAVIDGLWDVIAAKGFEKDMYFEMATRDIRALPKLEGTVHVNIALIVKFIPSYFFNHAAYPPVARRDEAANDDFLFDQGPARGLGKIAFHDYGPVFAGYDLPNVALFVEQISAFRELMTAATPDEAQRRDLDFLMALGEIFVLVVYAQLVLENARPYAVDDGLVDQIFDCLVRDVSHFALELYGKPSTTPAQMDHCLRMIRKPVVDQARYERVWHDHVYALKGAYRMND